MKTIVRLLALLLLLTPPASALQRGDSLPPALSKQLALDPQKIALVDFFASWCVSCRIELPEINELSHQLSGQPIEFVGIEVDEDPKLADAFLAELGLDFRVIRDPGQEIVSIFEPIGMPALYYIYDNKIIGVRYGAIPQIGQVITGDLRQLGFSQ